MPEGHVYHHSQESRGSVFPDRVRHIEEGRHVFAQNSFGVIPRLAIAEYLNDHNARCAHYPRCGSNVHHLIFDGRTVDGYVDTLTDADRDLHRLFYQSPLAKIVLPVCEHDYIQCTTASMDFPPTDVMETLLEEVRVLGAIRGSVLGLRKSYKHNTSGINDGRSVRDLSREGKDAYYEHIINEMDRQHKGNERIKELVGSYFSPDSYLLTPANLGNAGSYYGLWERLRWSRILNADRLNDRHFSFSSLDELAA